MPLLAKHKKEECISTPDYNIFKIFKVEFLEASMHTPFLINLLDIKGSHAQGNLFLFSFLEIFSVNKFFFTEPNTSNYLIIKAEHTTAYGVIDIFVYYKHPDKEKRFAVILENKIFAPDQDKQLERYYYYAKQELKLSDDKILVIYLKYYKELPESISISKGLRDDLISKGVLKLLSYNPDISNWLSACVNKIQSQRLNQILIQYIDLIKTFPYEEIES